MVLDTSCETRLGMDYSIQTSRRDVQELTNTLLSAFLFGRLFILENIILISFFGRTRDINCVYKNNNKLR